MDFFIQGLLLGLAYVAPIGLQNIFVINSALKHRFPSALKTAAIVIFFDVTLALACFFGIGYAMERYSWLRIGISAAGSIAVLIIGIRLILSKPGTLESLETDSTLLGTIAKACIVTWFNPQAIIDGTMMLGAFHASLPDHGNLSFICGVASASCLWFTGLSTAVSLSSHIFKATVMRIINVVCGVIITSYGARLMAEAAKELLSL